MEKIASARRNLILWGILLFLGLIFFIWSFRTVPLSDILQVVSNLKAWQLFVIFLINSGIILLFALRWWLILRTQGHVVPYLAATKYRLAAFTVSYFTPGQHFGGEPLQVFFVRQRHGVPGSTAVAAITLDKATELFSNFTVLAIGIALIAGWSNLTIPWKGAFWPSVGLMLAPAIYLYVVTIGMRPISAISRRYSTPIVNGLRNAEDQLGKLARRKPSLLIQGLMISALLWVVLFFEFWLVLLFLGLSVDWFQLIAIVIAGRIALLAPTPGALGALEASQMLTMQWLGFDPAYGLSLSLLIRVRDIFFGLIGLLWAGLGKA